MKKVNSFHLHTLQWYTPKEVNTSFLFFLFFSCWGRGVSYIISKRSLLTVFIVELCVIIVNDFKNGMHPEQIVSTSKICKIAFLSD
mgnify:CR=1 FL=1